MTTLVFGHTSPDTDSTGSPIIWAWYLTNCRDTPAEARLLGTPNSEAEFVLKRWGLDRPEHLEDVTASDRVVIVDTNNPGELPPSINEADIVEVIDHHRIAGGLLTKGPVNVTIRPVACTATIMHDLMGADAQKMPEAIKGAMLSCILSDTLEFRSPTTTDIDRQLAESLAADLGLRIPDYAGEMFAAKSDVSSYSNAELLRLDSKHFETGGMSFRVSVLETTSPSTVLSRKDAIFEDMGGVAEEDGVDEVLFFLVDILSEEALMFLPNDRVRAIASKSFGVEATGDLVALPGVVSRKKQIIPSLKV